jgi:4'-phosphopantetheinyl transferase
MVFWTLCEADARWPWWQGTAEPDFLAPEERGRLAGMRFPKRRREWLLGRRTAKSLLQHSALGYAHLPQRAIVVGNDPGGAPYFAVNGEGRLEASLSISHRDSLAFCALSMDPGLSVGADVECVEPRSPGLVRDFFTAHEAGSVDACPPAGRDRLITLIWSAKEAVLKALRLGLRADTRSVEIVAAGGLEAAPPASPGWYPVRARSELAASGDVAAWWRPHGGYVLTLAIVPRDEV